MFRAVELRPTRTRPRPRRAAGAALRSVGLDPAFPLAALPLEEGETPVADFGVTTDAAPADDPTSAAAVSAAALADAVSAATRAAAAASAAGVVAGLRAASVGTRGAGLRWLGCPAWPRRDCGDKAILLTMPGAAFRGLAPVLATPSERLRRGAGSLSRFGASVP
jgi:hypothetical protein